MVSFVLHWFWVGVGTIFALAALGVLGASSDVIAVPAGFGGPNFDRKPLFVQVIIGFLGLAFSGAVLAIGCLMLAIPSLFFKFALSWKWEDSFLPGVFSGIGLAIVAMVIATIHYDKKMAREKQFFDEAYYLKVKREEEGGE